MVTEALRQTTSLVHTEYSTRPELRREGYMPELIVPFVDQNRQPVDWSRIATEDTRALFLGYPSRAYRGSIRRVSEVITRYTALNLQALKKTGFTHLGTDIFEAFTQLLLDHYSKTGERKGDLLKYLDGYCGGFHDGYVDNIDAVTRKERTRDRRPRHPVKLIEASRDVLLSPLGLGHQNFDPYDSFGGTDFESDLNYEKFIADKLTNTLYFEPTSRVVALLNSRHAGDNEFKVAGLVKKAGYKTVSVYLSGREDKEISSCIDTAAEEMGLADQEFMLPRLPEELGVISNYDWVIHVAKQKPNWRVWVNKLKMDPERKWIPRDKYFIDLDWGRDYLSRHVDQTPPEVVQEKKESSKKNKEKVIGVCPLIIHPRNPYFSLGVQEQTWKRLTNKLGLMWSPGFETVNPRETQKQAIERYLEEELGVVQGRVLLPPVLERSLIAKIQLTPGVWLYVYPCLASEDLRVKRGSRRDEVGPPVWMYSGTVVNFHKNGNGFSFRPGTKEIYDSYFEWRKDPLKHTPQEYHYVTHSVPSEVFDLLEAGFSQKEALSHLGLGPQRVLAAEHVGAWLLKP